MKKKFSFMWLLSTLFMFFIVSCNNEDSPDLPVSKGTEAVQNIVKALETKPEVSQFVEILKEVNLADINEDELTVFAVKNSETALLSRATVLDSVSIRRHIAVGSYSKNELTDGLILKSIDGENLYISRQEDKVSVNGVNIEGEEITVENSCVYVVPDVIESQSSPAPTEPANINDLRELWNKEMTAYADKSYMVEASLTTGYLGFNFNDIIVFSEDYWNKAHNTIKAGEKYLSQISEIENVARLADTIKVELAIIKTHLYCYYNQYISNGHVCRMEELEAEFNNLISTLPTPESNAISLMLAKANIFNGNYDNAKSLCEKIINSGEYHLSGGPYSIDSKESLWKGYENIVLTDDGGKDIMYPILYREAYFIKGLAGYALGNEHELLEALNTIAVSFKSTPIDNLDKIEMDQFIFYIRNTGGTYPYYRILTNINYDREFSYSYAEGFDKSKHLLLPVPQKALDEYPQLKQNDGY